MNKSILFTLLLFLSIAVWSQNKTEIRAAWLTGIYGLDWPHTHAVSESSQRRQQQELCDILDNLQRMNFNVIIFQTRIRGDVAYPSNIEPFNEVFTGREGGNPGYDPLAFAIQECHKRGMECHAWMVAMPLGKRMHVASLKQASIVKKEPSITCTWGGEYYLNPAVPGTARYLASLVREVVTKYDVDGVQFDYLRYPDHVSNKFDALQYARYGNGEDREEWRRNNITAIIRTLYKEIKSIKPWVKVSTCPIGKYRDLQGYSSNGFNAYHVVYQDPQKWMREGIQDIIFPMMYFRDNNFYPFARDWQDHSYGRYVAPGLGIYFMDANENKGAKLWRLSDINDEIKFIRENKMAGACYFRTSYLMRNVQQIADILELSYYSTPALTPSMHWMDSIPPSTPIGLQINRVGMSTQLAWSPSTDNDEINQPQYIVYGANSWPVDTNDPGNILAIKVAGHQYIYNNDLNIPSLRYFAVTAVDRYGNESAPAQMSKPLVITNHFDLLTSKLSYHE